VDGKAETRLYANVLKQADVEVYKATRSDQNCCDGKMAARHTKSDKLGRFEAPGFQSGWYWLRIESNFQHDDTIARNQRFQRQILP